MRNTPMAIINIATLLFVLIIMIRIQFCKSVAEKENNQKRKEFWEREALANQTRKKDISSLDFIQIPVENLPFHFVEQIPVEHTASIVLKPLSSSQKETLSEELVQELTFAEQQILKLTNQRIKNFTGLSNTDLKLAYGAANLNTLSGYDQNFTVLVRTLQKWGDLLCQANWKEDAIQVFSYAVSIESDVASTYTMLATLYKEAGEAEKIDQLILDATLLPTLLNTALVEKLTDIRDSSVPIQ